MDEIFLKKPDAGMERAALALRQAHFDAGEDVINGAALLDKIESYGDWLAHLDKLADKAAAPENWVHASTFFVVRERDGALVGIIDIRHELNDFLRRAGGHIGYSVVPGERRKGYAGRMLALALDYCRELGLAEVLLSCDADNEPSRRTILANGGEFLEEFYSEDFGCQVQRYVIKL